MFLNFLYLPRLAIFLICILIYLHSSKIIGRYTNFSRFSFQGLPFHFICHSDGMISLGFKVLPLLICPNPSDIVVCLSVLFLKMDFLEECRNGDTCLKPFFFFFFTAVRWDLSQSQAVRGFLTNSKLHLIKLWWVLTLLLPFRKKIFNKRSWHYYFHILEASSVLLKRLKKIVGVVSDKDTDFHKENQVKEGQVFLHSYQGLFWNFCIRYHFDFWKCF